jgi:hypothetical protein
MTRTRTPSLLPFEIASCEGIIASGEACLARWTATNPMRSLVERQIEAARAKLGR